MFDCTTIAEPKNIRSAVKLDCVSPGHWRALCKQMLLSHMRPPPELVDYLAEGWQNMTVQDDTFQDGMCEAVSHEWGTVLQGFRAYFQEHSGIPQGLVQWGDDMTIVCSQAAYHTDPSWPHMLFLTWYMAGLAVDFHVGKNPPKRLSPGDIFLFDPANTHGVTRPGERSIIALDECPCFEDMSFFLSQEILLTPELMAHLKIEHGTDASSLSNGPFTHWSLAKHHIQWQTGRILHRPRIARRGPVNGYQSG